MAQTMVNFRMDEELKKNMEQTCHEMGMSMTTAFIIFAKKVTKERRIPFEVTADPFYSESNMRYLDSVISDIESGKAQLQEHELEEGSCSGKNGPERTAAHGSNPTGSP